MAEEANSLLHQAAGEVDEAAGEVVVVLKGEPFTAHVRRPIHSRRSRKQEAGGEEEAAAEEELEEVVTVKMTMERHQFFHMNLFINKPSASETTPIADCPEFATAFNHSPLLPPPPHAGQHVLHTFLFRFGISDIVSGLGLSKQTHLLLTFVPTGRFKDVPVTINNITIDLE